GQTTNNESASRDATRCHVVCVRGWPCKSTTGCPWPPQRTRSVTSPTSTYSSAKPSNTRSPYPHERPIRTRFSPSAIKPDQPHQDSGSDFQQLAAAGVEPAAGARVAAAGALHHAAALLAGRTEVETLAHGGQNRWLIGQRGCGGLRRSCSRTAVAAIASVLMAAVGWIGIS